MEKIQLDIFYKELDQLLKSNDPQKVEEYFLVSLDKAAKMGDIAVETAIYNEMGGFYRATDKSQLAISIYKRVMKNMVIMGTENTDKHMAVFINLGSVYSSISNWSMALKQYMEAQKILENLQGERTYLRASLYNNMSGALKNMGEVGTAETLAKEALKLIKTMKNTFDEQATTCITLGEIQIKKGDFNKARESLEESLKLFQEKIPSSIHYPVALATMGELCFLEKRKEESIKYYKEAMAQVERKMGKIDSYYKLEQNLREVKERCQ